MIHAKLNTVGAVTHIDYVYSLGKMIFSNSLCAGTNLFAVLSGTYFADKIILLKP